MQTQHTTWMGVNHFSEDCSLLKGVLGNNPDDLMKHVAIIRKFIPGETLQCPECRTEK